MPRPVLTIHGENFSTLNEFYDEIERVLIPGVPWGRNLDAFHDLLRGGFGTPVGGFVLVWQRSDLSRKRLGHAEAASQLQARLDRCHPTARPSVAAQLELARSGSGPTVFDWLVQIIREHGPGGPESADGVELILN